MELRYTAIVLKKREVGETDRIYTFFTKEAGKLSSIAKGVRKSEAKLASSLETGSKVEVMVVRTRGMGKVAGAVLEESFPATRQNFEALRLVVEVLTTFDRLVEPDERDEALYTLLEGYVRGIENLVASGHADKLALMTEAFFLKLCFHLGYTLQLNTCALSGAKLQSGERYLLSPTAGGVVSTVHAREVNDGLVVSEDTIKLLRLFARASLEQLTKLIVGTNTLNELTRFRKIFLAWIRH